jgi:hypothetical protein
MMMYTPSMLYEMGKAREREMLEAVEKERLTRLAMSEQPSRLSGLVSGIRGRLLCRRPFPAAGEPDDWMPVVIKPHSMRRPEVVLEKASRW